MKAHWSDALVKLYACNEAVRWARTKPSLATAWQKCKRGDWMLWFAARVAEPNSPEHKTVVLAGCACARMALPMFEKACPGDNRPRVNIETAERWAHGKATIAEVKAAAGAAADAAWAAGGAALAVVATEDAAGTAAEAALAAGAAADDAGSPWAAAGAARAAAEAALAAGATEDAAAPAARAPRAASLAQSADIVRQYIPKPPELKGQS